MLVLVILGLLCGGGSEAQNTPPSEGGLRVAFQWKYIDWDKPNVELTGKNFTLGNPFTHDVDIDKRGRVFVTSPQWLEGTPISLSVITNLEGPGGPLLTPYPDWSWHRPTCDSIVTVYRIAIDECDRLWIIDTGKAEGKQVCPSKILVFDLKTDRALHKYTIPFDQLTNETSLVTPVVEVEDKCLDAHVYIADVSGNAILVYSFRDNESWRLNNTKGNAFGPDKDAMNITIVGEYFDLTDGTLGLSLSPKGFFKKRYLYFNSLASYHQKFASTDDLKVGDYEEMTIYESVNKRISQAGAQAISRTGALFFPLVELTAVACWNIQRPFNDDNIVILALDDENLQYISGMKVISNARGEEELWLNTNRLQKTINKTRKMDEVNFRLIRGKVKDLIKDTACDYSADLKSKAPNTTSWRKI